VSSSCGPITKVGAERSERGCDDDGGGGDDEG
jgi:hypothetical protein